MPWESFNLRVCLLKLKDVSFNDLRSVSFLFFVLSFSVSPVELRLVCTLNFSWRNEGLFKYSCCVPVFPYFISLPFSFVLWSSRYLMLLYVTSVRYSGVFNLSYKLLYVGNNHKDLSYSEKLKERHKNTISYACPFWSII